MKLKLLGTLNFHNLLVLIKNVENIEQAGRVPKGEMLEAVCKKWPKYTLWLMTGQTNELCEQVSPEIEKARRKLKTTGTDIY